MDWKGGYESFENSFETKRELESIDGSPVLYFIGNNQPFSGSVERNSSQRVSVDQYNAGLLEGKSIRKSTDGSWVEAHYKGGKLHGKMIFYDRDGQIRSIMNYDKGEILTEISD